MATYDFKQAKKLIQLNSDKLIEASLGIKEDWFWTANTVYEEGKFVVDLDAIKEIAGITGSCWGTPTLQLRLKGEEATKMIDISLGTSDISKRPIEFNSILGVLAAPCQEEIDKTANIIYSDKKILTKIRKHN